jgi:DNA mismatch endonuclease (patch repair protein)
MGYRYRLHRRDLPGRPDLAFTSRRKVIFVHGCFWHRHSCRFGKVKPKTNEKFWSEKIAGNVARDKEILSRLAELGWQSLVLWECELSDASSLAERIHKFLSHERI